MLDYPKWLLFIVCTAVVVTIFVGFIDGTMGIPSATVLSKLETGNVLSKLDAVRQLIFWDYAWLTPPWDVISYPFIAMNLVFIFLLSWSTWLGRLLGR